MLLRANTTFKRTEGQEISEDFFLVFKYSQKTNELFLQISTLKVVQDKNSSA